MANKVQSVIGLLDNFFGATWAADTVDKLSSDDLDALARDVNDFYAGYTVPSNSAGLRSYSGGATFTANIKRPSDQSAVKVTESQILPFAHAATLYSDQIVVDCPLDAWIFSYRDFQEPGKYWDYRGRFAVTPMAAHWAYGDGFFNATEDESRSRIKSAINKLDVLAPAIRAGWILPVPHLRIWKERKHQIATQVRKDILDLDMLDVIQAEYVDPPAHSDVLRGLAVTPEGGVRPVNHAASIIENPSIYFNSVMAVADATDSRYLPTADSDFALVRHRIQNAGKLNRVIRDGLAVGTLHRVLLPSFEDVPFETICDIRRSESAFAAWRDGVRGIIEGDSPIGKSEQADYGEIMAEHLAAYVAGIEADVARSRTLSGRLEALKPDAIDFALAAATWLIPPDSILALVKSLAAPLVRRALMSMVSSKGSANSVIVKLGRA